MQLLKFRPYAQKFNEILNNLGSDIGEADEGKYSKVEGNQQSADSIFKL